MKTIIPGKVNINHVMWQPFNGCTRNCPGCYAKASTQDKGYGGCELLHLMYSKDPVVIADQFTISLDSVKKVPIELHNSLLSLWEDYYRNEKGSSERGLPQLCITCRDLETLNFWIEELGVSRREFLYPVTVLSLSDDIRSGYTPPELQKDLKGASTILNRNLLITDSVAKEEHPFNINGMFDSVYVTLFKQPLSQLSEVKDIANWCKVILKADESFCKVIPDACMIESLKYSHNGNTCTAGIDKVHVWAKGAATACPYDAGRWMHRLGDREVNEDIFIEIEQATTNMKDSPCHSCTIPDTIDVLEQTDPELVKAVINKLGIKY